MTFEAISNMISGQKPYYLYLFSRDSVNYQFTNKKADITKVVSGVASPTWVTETISHSNILDSDQASRTELTITVPIDNDFAFDELGSFISTPTTVKIWKGFLNDPDGELVVQYVGRVTETSANDSSSTISLKCMTEMAALQRKGLPAVIQRPCRHVHYGRGCNLVLSAWQTELPVASISSNGITVTITGANAEPNGHYQLGILEWGGKFEMMLTHVGNVVTLVNPIPGLVTAVGAGATNVKIAPGCPLSRNICNERFSNIENFGGFPFISDNIFDGRQVF
jgi:uncharacterized phage protein (TIGR02218 family)